VGRSGHTRLLRDERQDIHKFLAGLSEEDWSAPSLCLDWTVLEVAAHLSSSVGLSRVGVVKRGLRYGTGTVGANRRTVTAWTAKGSANIVASFGERDLLGLGFFYPGWALSEAVVHHQDMRRALGRPRTIPGERLRVALATIVKLPTGTGANRRRRGVALRATDIDWSLGTGPEVVGPAESILMTLAGRRDALGELVGPGTDRLEDSLL